LKDENCWKRNTARKDIIFNEKTITKSKGKNCGKEIEKHRILCDECKKTFRKDSRRKYYYSHRYGIKENQPIVRHCKRCGKKIGKYKQLCDRCKEILNGKRPTVRYCKKCGKEIEKRRHFCDECLNIKMKEYTKAYTKAYYNRPEIKEKQKEYYKRPEINEKRKEYYREYSKRKRAEAKQKTKSCPK
jgi:predicted nucleic acid-binding Zn ribbon protein